MKLSPFDHQVWNIVNLKVSIYSKVICGTIHIIYLLINIWLNTCGTTILKVIWSRAKKNHIHIHTRTHTHTSVSRPSVGFKVHVYICYFSS
jgi:hypothetical protein